MPSACLRVLLLACGLAQLTGCALLGRPAPDPPLECRDVVQALRQKEGLVRTVTDAGVRLRVTAREDGEPRRYPSLGAVLAFDSQKPGLWLRGEKLGHEVFSLRALGERFWVAVHPSRLVMTGGPVAYAKLPRYFLRPAEVQGFLAGPDWLGLSWTTAQMTVGADSYRFDVHLMDTLYRTVLVDRRDLVITRISAYDVLGRETTRVELSDHGPADGTLFPRRLTVTRPQEGITLSLRLRRPKFNKELPLSIFQPIRLDGYEQVDLDSPSVGRIELVEPE